MKASLHRCVLASLHRFHDSTIQRFNGFTFCHAFIICVLLFPPPARAEFSSAGSISARSISGQFIAGSPAQFSWLAALPRVAAATNFVRLEPALLVVSAERIKDSLYRRLEIQADVPSRGQIFLAVHLAQSLDENVTIVSRISADGCSYRVELPDVLPRRNFTRAIIGVTLLEFANRTASSLSTEIPAWLTDGLAEEMLAAGSPEIILSAPAKTLNGLPVTQINVTQRGLDSLTAARRVLGKFPPLTFEELSWPTDAQLNGDDGGAYRASAQVLVGELLRLNNGPRHLRAMLESLPRGYNWQTAFQSAFREIFPQPLNFEKWWALQIAGFAAHDRGRGWTLAISRARLDEILSVPVEMRATSNSLPAHAEISLQAVIRNLDSTRQNEILQARLRDLEFAQFRMAPQLAALADGYRRVLAGYLGEPQVSAPVPPRSGLPSAALQKSGVAKTLKKLEALDERRRIIESTIKTEASM
jgi:hypothetical protein